MGHSMTEVVSRQLLEAFYTAYATGDAVTAAKYLADDVEWTISGPVDVLSFCGTRRGKPAVLELIEREIPAVLRITSIVADAVLIDGDQAATLARLSARSAEGRMISYRLAHFTSFRDGRIVRNLSIIDSYNAAEQVLGHSLAAHEDLSTQTGSLIAV